MKIIYNLKFIFLFLEHLKNNLFVSYSFEIISPVIFIPNNLTFEFNSINNYCIA